MDIVFLDASVLFAAGYRPRAKCLKLWELPEVRLITSTYAADEAARNLSEVEQRARLADLMRSVELMGTHIGDPLPAGIDLPAKRRPDRKAHV